MRSDNFLEEPVGGNWADSLTSYGLKESSYSIDTHIACWRSIA